MNTTRLQPPEDVPLDGTDLPQWRRIAATGEDLRYSDFLSFRLGRLAVLIQREVAVSYLELAGLSQPEWRVMARLAQHGAFEMRNLTRVCFMDKAAISRTVDRLIDKGLAERVVDPAHARRRIVAATPAGHRLMAKALPVAHREQAALLRELTADEREQFGHLLHKLTSALMARAPA